jgi:vitamin B12 transporter
MEEVRPAKARRRAAHGLSGKTVRANVCVPFITMSHRFPPARSVESSLVCLSAPFLAMAAAPVVAQTPATLPETVVTATRNTQLVSSTLPHTTVISRADIERSQASDLVTLLQREAGLQRTQNGGVGSVSSIFMRGAPSLQTLVLIDGVPLNKQDASGAVSLNT